MSINWRRVLLNIRRAGVPMSKLARRVRMDEQTLRNYARGECTDPRWSQALALLDAHAEICPAKHCLDELRA